jgi:hypothetical protein
MNIWQRIIILVGAIIITLLFTVSPYKYGKEVLYHPNEYNPKAEKYRTEQFIDYKTTLLEGVAVAVLTAGAVVFLGAIKKKQT